MEKVRYTISDAAQMMDVESHALRYWEEELDLSVRGLSWSKTCRTGRVYKTGIFKWKD